MHRYVIICFLSSTKRYHLAVFSDSPIPALPGYPTVVNIMALTCDNMDPVGVATMDDALEASWKLHNLREEGLWFCRNVMELDQVLQPSQRLLVGTSTVSASSNEPTKPGSWPRIRHP